VSILGIRTFNFSRLPKSRNNKYTILKLALRSYLNLFIDNFDNLDSDQKQQSKAESKRGNDGGLMGFIMRFVSTLTLDSADPIEKLKGLISKDHKHFDYEDIGNFMEVGGCDNILDIFHIPVLVQFENFEQDFENELFSDNQTLAISEKEVYSLKIHHKPIENHEKNRILKNFIVSEISFYRQLKEYQDESFKNIVKIYEEIAESLLKQFFNADLTNITALFDNAENPPAISSSCIAKIYLDNFDSFFTYFSFITAFERVPADNYDLKMKMTDVLTKLTSYSKAFNNICEIDDTNEARELSLKFYRLNSLLNEHSEKHHLASFNNLRKMLSKKNSILENEDILCAVNCTDLNADARYRILLFTNHIVVVDKHNDAKMTSRIHNVDIVLYNKFLYLILPENIKPLLQFQKIAKEYKLDQDNTSIVAFRSFNREATENFRERYYQAKYKLKKRDGYFYCFLHPTGHTCEDSLDKSTSDFSTDTFHDRIVVSSLGDPEPDQGIHRNVNNEEMVHCVKIEDYCFRVGGIEKLTQKELLERINEKVKQKRIEVMNISKNLNTIMAIIKHADESRLKLTNIDVYPEDEVMFQRKREVFEQICSTILKSSNEPDQMKYSVENIVQLLEESIINECSDANKHYNRVYYTLLYSQSGTECISYLPSLEDKIVLLCMLVHRNLYYFFDSEDLERLNENTIHWDPAEKMRGFKSYTLEYFKKIISVIKHLRYIGKDVYKEMLVRVMLAKPII
ncbi:uncharacterized protein VICG_00302, partial [Vittaforma corneae ATCC 50505]